MGKNTTKWNYVCFDLNLHEKDDIFTVAIMRRLCMRWAKQCKYVVGLLLSTFCPFQVIEFYEWNGINLWKKFYWYWKMNGKGFWFNLNQWESTLLNKHRDPNCNFYLLLSPVGCVPARQLRCSDSYYSLVSRNLSSSFMEIHENPPKIP